MEYQDNHRQTENPFLQTRQSAHTFPPAHSPADQRYAYWSVFAGACGHTYGDNSVMQFYTEESEGVTYGAEDYWQDAMHHEGSGQMGHLKRQYRCSRHNTGAAGNGNSLPRSCRYN